MLRDSIIVLAAALVGCAGCGEAAPLPPTGPKVEIQTSRGNIVICLYGKASPRTCAQFQRLVDSGYYDGLAIDRVLPRRLVEAGRRPTGTSRVAPAPTVRNEWANGLKNLRANVAMCRRVGDPRVQSQAALVAAQNSASDAFFINVGNNTQYDRRQVDGAGYTVFGRVIAGMDVVDAIAKSPVRRDAATGEPGELLTPVTIIHARMVPPVSETAALTIIQ